MKPVKVLYIESKLKNLEDFRLSKEEIAKLPKTLFLAYSIQYKSLAIIIKKQLEEIKIKVTNTQQVLGCSKVNTKDPILLIGAGRFHALNLYLQNSEVYILDNNKITKISENEINSLKSKRRSALLKFLSAESIGILVSSKPGQENLDLAIKLKQKLIKKGKNAFIFISNNIDINQFENFQIDSWVNTSCSGLTHDNPNIINYSEIPKF
jgi:diphthamide biosynthesis enzyme Dph1/Dph2-like protein